MAENRHIADVEATKSLTLKLTGARLAVPKKSGVSASLLNAKLGRGAEWQML